MLYVSLDRVRRVVAVRVSGTIKIEELERVAREARWVTDQLAGGEHIVLADMRGMAPMSADAARILGELIRYGRERGTACCVHLSDSSIARLQAARLAREASPQDNITINVVSVDEAERVIEEKQKTLKRPAA
jgi:hypothetical protein